jgi:hypothetical protein
VILRSLGSLVVVLVTSGGARASSEPGPLALHVELIEQAACLVSRDAYHVWFEMRTVYVNQGRVPVSIAIGAERIVTASFTPAEDREAGADDAQSFAVPAGSRAAAAGQTTTGRVIEPGWAASGRTSVWLPLTTGSDAARLTPGDYTARFDVSVVAAEVGSGAASLEPVRLSTAPLAVTIHPPTQVQECGSSSGTLPAYQVRTLQ